MAGNPQQITRSRSCRSRLCRHRGKSLPPQAVFSLVKACNPGQLPLSGNGPRFPEQNEGSKNTGKICVFFENRQLLPNNLDCSKSSWALSTFGLLKVFLPQILCPPMVGTRAAPDVPSADVRTLIEQSRSIANALADAAKDDVLSNGGMGGDQATLSSPGSTVRQPGPPPTPGQRYPCTSMNARGVACFVRRGLPVGTVEFNLLAGTTSEQPRAARSSPLCESSRQL